MNKYKCSGCGAEIFSDEKPECFNKNFQISVKHNMKKSKELDCDDYATLWEDDLENANRHDSTEMPRQILETLEKNIEDKSIILKIMKELYKKEIGV